MIGSPDLNDLVGVILAAGAGCRLGRPKALCRTGGRWWLERLAGALREGGCRRLLVVTRPELERRLRSICGHLGLELLINPLPERGQISSLRRALREAAEAGGMLVVLVDQGEVRPGTVRRVRLALAGGEAAVAAFRGRIGHPLAFRRSLFEKFLSHRADRGAHRVVERLAAEGRLLVVNTRDPGVVRNINTRQERRRFQKDCSSLTR